MSELKYLHMLPDETSWYENEAPFSEAVAAAFPSTAEESKEAAKCFAVGRSTASVFHCMRVLEGGLRAMAADVGVNFDVQNWQNVIDQIEAAIRQLGKSLPHGPSKNERLKQLSEAAAQFVYFKDGWRNHVAHNRTSYDQQQALSMLNHAKEFMGSLASWLKE